MRRKGGKRSGTSSATRSAQAIKSKRIDPPTSKPAATPTSLIDFWRLPQELRTFTLELACYLPPTKEATASSSNKDWHLHLDTPTVAHLALVSHESYSNFNPLLYSRVLITRPSTLSSFHSSLTSRPGNADHVTSLHLGPLSDLAPGWWPVTTLGETAVNSDEDSDNPVPLSERANIFLETSLTMRDEERGLLPRWVKPERGWEYKRSGQDCQERAVCKAIKAALKGVDVDPYEELMDAKGLGIGIDEWTERVFEVQAILDLYLGAMKQVEEEKQYSIRSWRSKKKNVRKRQAKCRTSECGHYPTLVLEGFEREGDEAGIGEKVGKEEGKREENEGAADASSLKATAAQAAVSREAKEEQVIVTRDQVKAHLSRPGAYTDHFDHPLMYARSYLQLLALDDSNNVIIDYDGERTWEFYSDDEEDDEDDSELDSIFGSDWDSEYGDEEAGLVAFLAGLMNDGTDEESEDEEDEDDEEEEEAEGNNSEVEEDSKSSSSSESGSGSSQADESSAEFDSVNFSLSNDNSTESSSASSSSASSEVSLSDTSNSTTRPGLIVIARAVLDLTKRVKNLSLTGYFHECLDPYKPRCKVLDQLLHLSIGPLLPHSETMDCLQGIRLPAMEKLRICGGPIGRGTALQIAGRPAQSRTYTLKPIWPSLLEATWEFGDYQAPTDEDAAELLQLFNLLSGRKASASSPDISDEEESVHSNSSLQQENGGARQQNDEDFNKASPHHHSRHIEARLPPDLFLKALGTARDTAVSGAWVRGVAAPEAANVLRISQSQAVKKRKSASGRDDYSQDVGLLRRESLTWWEERVVELAGRKRPSGEEDKESE